MSATLLERLKNLHQNGPAPRKYGICTQVRGITALETGYMHHLMLQWPGCSEHFTFIVPARRSDTSAKSAQNAYAYCNTVQMWDRNTEYGALRWELLEWMIEELQK